MLDLRAMTDSELADAMAELMRESRARRRSPPESRHRPLRRLHRIERLFGSRRHEAPLDWPNGLPMLRISHEIRRRERFRTDFRPSRPTRDPALQFAHLAPEL
jgi:hypothetical protein